MNMIEKMQKTKATFGLCGTNQGQDMNGPGNGLFFTINRGDLTDNEYISLYQFLFYMFHNSLMNVEISKQGDSIGITVMYDDDIKELEKAEQDLLNTKQELARINQVFQEQCAKRDQYQEHREASEHISFHSLTLSRSKRTSLCVATNAASAHTFGSIYQGLSGYQTLDLFERLQDGQHR